MILQAVYLKQPAPAEVFYHGGGTDIILRRSITSAEEPVPEEPEAPPVTVWHCEELQLRKAGQVTLKQAQSSAAALWERAARDPVKEPLPTLEQRIEALEAVQLAMLDMGV